MEKKNRIYIILTAAVLIAAIGIVALGVGNLSRNRTAQPQLQTLPVPQETVEIIREVEVEKIVEREKTITGEILQEGLNQMGFLVTQEYSFTEVVNYSDARRVAFWGLHIPIGEASYVISYDGQVEAGIDFGDIAVTKDEEKKTITVSVPQAKLQKPTIDHSSFRLYSQKNNVFAPIIVEDFNGSLIELEQSAMKRAEEKDILEKGNENARLVISNFVRSLVDISDYTLKIETINPETGGV